MFNKRYIILASLGVVALSSCGKKFLDKKPIAVVTDENFYKTENDIISAVNAAYDPLNWNIDRGQSIYYNDYFYGDVASDDSRKGSTESDLGDINAFDKFQLTPRSVQVLHTWRTGYRGIYLTNLVIKNAPNASASQAVKNNVIGQAQFLRAYYHFKLTNIFGRIPLVTTVLQDGEFNVGNSPKEAIYAQIEADLKDAIAKLPSRGQTQEGRATKGAAQALLMRVYLFQKKWSELLSLYNEFEAANGGKYALEANYADVFSLAKTNGKETIFAIQASDGDNGDPDNAGRRFEGLLQSVMTAPRGDYGGWGFNRPTLNLVNEFRAENDSMGNPDPRLKATVVSNGDKIGALTIVIPASDSTGYPYTRYYNRKYILDQIAKTPWISTINFIAIRYADVLLMASEAANELGRNGEALAHLNKVRRRSGMKSKTTTDQGALRNEIWRERRVELAMEGLRFFDIVRQGRAGAVMRATKTDNFVEGEGFRDGVHEVFPIPQEEIDLSQGALQQNPGYN